MAFQDSPANFLIRFFKIHDSSFPYYPNRQNLTRERSLLRCRFTCLFGNKNKKEGHSRQYNDISGKRIAQPPIGRKITKS